MERDVVEPVRGSVVEAVRSALGAATARMRAGTRDADPTTATVTAAIVEDGRATFLQVGDHAGYVRRGAELRRVTPDHSLAAFHGPDHAHVTTRGLGTPDERIDEVVVELDAGWLVLVSRAIVRAMPADELAALASGDDLQRAADAVIAAAHARVPGDRVSVIVARRTGAVTARTARP